MIRLNEGKERERERIEWREVKERKKKEMRRKLAAGEEEPQGER